MRGFSCLAIMLYLSLLCNALPGHAYDSRLSPLADNQFHAVSPLLNQAADTIAQDDNSDHDPSLLNSFNATLYCQQPAALVSNSIARPISLHYTLFARGPPNSLTFS